MIPEDQDTRRFKAERQLLIVLIELIGFLGVAIMLYGVVAIVTNDTWGILEKIANYLAVIATSLGTVITALSIYLPQNTRPPTEVSKRYTAPIVTVVALAVLIVYLYRPTLIHPHMVNGLAMLAISGGLFRLVCR